MNTTTKIGTGTPNCISPNVYAKIGGILYIIMIILGIIEEVFVKGKIVVSGNAAATAANLKSNEMLWRWGIAIELSIIIVTVFIGLVIYVLTKPVNKNLAILAAFFNLLAIGTEAAYALHLVQAIFPVENTPYLNAFTPEQLNVLTSLAIKSQGMGFAIVLLLFGPFFFVTGYLIFKSEYLPRVLGLLYIIPGISYMLSSFLLILAPEIGAKYYFFVAGPALIGELALSLWLLIKGVSMEKWNEVLKRKQEVYQG
jgi:hypothetical protein